MSAGRTVREVAPGVYLLGTKWVNLYLVDAAGDLLLIDAGYPGYWTIVEEALRDLGRKADAIAGVVLTHHHVDHTGVAERVRSETDARVFVHEADEQRVRGEIASRPPGGFYKQAWRMTMLRYLTHTVRFGGAGYAPVSDLTVLHNDDMRLDLPGAPRVIHTPGHTAGHCSVVLDDRGVLFTGDAIQHYDYATGHARLQLHRFNESRDDARHSAEQLAAVDAELVLFGHGEPWPHGVRLAVERALAPS